MDLLTTGIFIWAAWKVPSDSIENIVLCVAFLIIAYMLKNSINFWVVEQLFPRGAQKFRMRQKAALDLFSLSVLMVSCSLVLFYPIYFHSEIGETCNQAPPSHGLKDQVWFLFPAVLQLIYTGALVHIARKRSPWVPSWFGRWTQYIYLLFSLLLAIEFTILLAIRYPCETETFELILLFILVSLDVKGQFASEYYINNASGSLIFFFTYATIFCISTLLVAAKTILPPFLTDDKLQSVSNKLLPILVGGGEVLIIGFWCFSEFNEDAEADMQWGYETPSEGSVSKLMEPFKDPLSP